MMAEEREWGKFVSALVHIKGMILRSSKLTSFGGNSCFVILLERLYLRSFIVARFYLRHSVRCRAFSNGADLYPSAMVRSSEDAPFHSDASNSGMRFLVVCHIVGMRIVLQRAQCPFQPYTVPLPLLASLRRSAHSNSPGSFACQFMAIPLRAFFNVSRELA